MCIKSSPSLVNCHLYQEKCTADMFHFVLKETLIESVVQAIKSLGLSRELCSLKITGREGDDCFPGLELDDEHSPSSRVWLWQQGGLTGYTDPHPHRFTAPSVQGPVFGIKFKYSSWCLVSGGGIFMILDIHSLGASTDCAAPAVMAFYCTSHYFADALLSGLITAWRGRSKDRLRSPSSLSACRPPEIKPAVKPLVPGSVWGRINDVISHPGHGPKPQLTTK